ncbi:MAG: hypothetical protein JO222_04915, partial [Frankiales bacterium]|nr:hypothetical protein [Frankiales bacterium]
MNRAGRWLAGLVCAASLCGAPAVAQAATPRPRLLVVAVPGLLWSDVASMPALAHYVSTAADADLSVRSQASTTRCADGLLTLSAGARTGGAGSACTVSSFAALARRDAGSGFTAHLGAFGQSLHNAGLRTAALDPAARLVIGDAHGQVDVVTTDVRGALSRADVVAAVVPSLYAASGPRRPAARHAADSAIRALLAAAPPAVAAAVVGASDAASGRSRLHVLALRGPSWQPGTLTSIRRASYVQLVDVAATLLHGIGVAPAATLGGRTAIASGPHPARIATLVDNDLHAWRAAQLSSPLRTVLWSTTMGLAVLWLAATRWPRLSGAARWSASLLAFAPVSTYLPQLVPWWRHGVAAYLVLLVSCTVALAVLAQLGSRRLRSASTALL